MTEVTVTPRSSNIESFSYDKDTETLSITFKSGATYDYFNVPPSAHRSFQSAGSYGEHFARHIRGRYAYEEV